MIMGDYKVGEVWWVTVPFSDQPKAKRRPAIVLDNDIIAILAVYVTSKNKDNPYSIEIEDWDSIGLPKPSWARIDRIISIDEMLMDCKIGELSQKDKDKILQLVTEYTSGKQHEFSIVAIKRNPDEYLQVYDNRWKCWLFPYVRSAEENNKDNVDRFVREIIGADESTEYITSTKHCKYSVSDSVYKIYNHKLYRLNVDPNNDISKKQKFTIDGIDYRWMTFEDMLGDENIMEKNEDVISFVKSKC